MRGSVGIDVNCSVAIDIAGYKIIGNQSTRSMCQCMFAGVDGYRAGCVYRWRDIGLEECCGRCILLIELAIRSDKVLCIF